MDNSLLSAPISSTYFSSAWVYKLGRVLFFMGTLVFNTQIPAAVTTVIGTIPEGYRPMTRAQVHTPQLQSSQGFAQITLNVDGTISIYQYGTNPISVNGAIQLNAVAISAN